MAVTARKGNDLSIQVSTGAHVGLTVPFLEDAIDWYTAHLGFRLLAGPLEVIEDGGELGRIGQAIYGQGFARWQFAHLLSPDGAGLELFQFDSPKTTTRENNFEYWFAGFSHIGLVATDIDATVAAVVAAGGKARTPVLTVNPEKGHRIAYLEDPWGSIIELCSHPYRNMWEQESVLPQSTIEVVPKSLSQSGPVVPKPDERS